MGRVLRIILVIVAIPFAVICAFIGLALRFRQRDELEHDDAAPIVTEEELEDSELEGAEDDWLRRWLKDVGYTQRGKLIRRGYAKQMFKPTLPWIHRQRKAVNDE